MPRKPTIQAWNYDDGPVAQPLFHEVGQDQPTMITDADIGDALAKAVRERVALEQASSRPSRMRLYMNLTAMAIIVMCIFIAAYVALKAKHR